MLDTLEEAVLHHQAGLRLLLQQIEDLRGTHSGLKVVLSGRYDLLEPGRFPDFVRLAAQTRSFQIPPFSHEEASDYLRSRRKLEPGHPVAAIVRKAEGNPFKLSLFADLALSRPSITAEEIENYPRFDFAYLIERVILRIPDEEGEVRWALRYGVIPRQLTLEFMREVMAPHIADAMRSERPRDRANETLPQLYAAKRPFRSDPGGPPVQKMDDVWSELQKYASSYGWVTWSESALQFQPEVVAPMRLLLQEQGLFRLLHRDAARYFKNRAATQRADPPLWAVSMAEAVYHTFQRYGWRASRYWKRCLACKQAQSVGVRRALSEVLISRDFLDDFGKPLSYRRSPEIREPIVDASTLALAYLEVASAAAQEGLESASSDRAPNVWEDARRYLDRALALDPHLSTGAGAQRWSMIEAAIEIGSGFVDKAVPILRDALEQDPDPAYRVVLRFQLGDALERLGGRGALAAYRTAYETARDLEVPPIPLHTIERRLGRLVQNSGDLDDARDHFERALHRLIAAPRQPSELAAAVLELAELDRLTGQWSATGPLLEIVERADVADRRLVQFAAASARVRAALDQNEPLVARQLLATCETSVHDARSRAVICELRAAVLGELCDITAAEAEFRAAQAEWRAAGSVVGGSYCLIQQARLVRKTGDNRSAQTLLDTIRRSGGAIDSALRAGIDMLFVEVLSMKQELSDATSLWRDLLDRPVVHDVTMRHASVLSAGLATGLSDDPADWSALCDTLESIWPKPARLVAVQHFQRAEHMVPPRDDIRARLESAVPELASADIAGLALNAVAFHSAIGAAARARRELDRAIAHALRADAAYLLRH
jgi:tetratricopeptide (TPR) repeat protein